MGILNKIKENSLKYPDRKAVIGVDGEITYSELWEKTTKFAIYLRSIGLSNGDTVILECMQNTGYVIALCGIMLAGGIVVPIEKNCDDIKLNKYIQDTSSKIIITQKFFTVNLIEVDKYISNIEFNSINIPDENNISEILYTTGTTGNSEGIMHTFRSQYYTVDNKINLIQDTEHYTAMIVAPLNHAFGERCLYYHLILGNTAFIQEKIMPLKKLFQNIDKYQISSIALNPSALAIILSNSGDTISQFAHQIKYMEFSSSPLSAELLKQIMALLPYSKMYNTYGSTEAGCITGFDNAKELHRLNSIGKPNIHSNVFIVDDNGKKIEGNGIHNSGLLAMSGPLIMKGYYNNVVGTNETLKNGMYITKDVTYRDNDGYYYLLGRKSDIISIGGLKVAPDEVEDIIRKYPGVIECACVGKNDSIAGQVPVLFITVNDEYNGTEIYDFIKDKLEPYKCPKEIHIIDEIPKTFNGKIIRKDLRAKINS